jgi:hypothetical protein
MSNKVVANSAGQLLLQPQLLPQITAAEVTGANNGSRPDLLAFPDKVYALSTDNSINYKVQAGVLAVYAPAGEIAKANRNTGTASFTVPDYTDIQILAGSGTIVVTFPALVTDGQELVVSLETAYTAITYAGNGKTVIAGVAQAVTAGAFARWRYNLANTTWHRVG